jgi:hypothetical protein
VSVYVQAAIVRKWLNPAASLHTLMQVFSVSVFEKMRMQSAFSPEADNSEGIRQNNQLKLFDF